jgi:leucyl/phenylalanyl-tRNA--protein transferase
MVFQLSRELILFPDPRHAESDGLLAVGGDLRPERLLAAYRRGIYPWYSDEYPILWWCPDPRYVLFPENFRVSRSLQKLVHKESYRITVNRAFRQVIGSCAKVPRPGQGGTWITADMMDAYTEMHKIGHAVSVEAWQGTELAGGLYGVVIGKCFFGESMFACAPNASKVAFVHFVGLLKKQGFRIIDCQMRTEHLERFGGQFIPLKRFLEIIGRGCDEPPTEWPEALDLSKK